MIVDRMSRLHRRVIQCIVVLGAACLVLSSGGSLISPVQAQGFMHMAGPRFQSRAPGVMPRYAPRYAPGYGPRYEPRFGQRFGPGYARRYGPRFAPDEMRSAGPRTVRNGRTDTHSRSATRAGKMTRRDAGLSNAGRRGQRDPSSARATTTSTNRPPVDGRAPPRVVRVWPSIPYVRYLPNTYPSCTYAGRDSSGECTSRPAFVADLGTGGSDGPPPVSQNGAPRRAAARAAVDRRYVADQIVAELDASLSDAQVAALARRYRLALVSSQDFPLIGSKLNLFRITDGRSVDTVRRQLASDSGVRSAQPNFRYVLQDQTSTPAVSEGDPAQYAVAKLRLPQAHALSHGGNVTVAVIDSGIDANHPELADTIAGSFDALGSKEGPHVHGTGIAGAIVSHARLIGSAPAARILAIRAFGVTKGGAESTSFVILKSLDYAAGHGAQVINMSFAGPKDTLVERGLVAASRKGIVLVAASGNAGPKSPPLYPAASPGVIAVSATDAYDRLFPASNRGSHIAVAAPGVDVFLPAPGGKYQMTSGTSFSAAYVSGLAALMVSRDPAIKPDDVRSVLMRTARDLGAPGRDDLFGAGEADAFDAVSAVTAPVATTADSNATTSAPPSSQNRDATVTTQEPQPELASGKPAVQ